MPEQRGLHGSTDALHHSDVRAGAAALPALVAQYELAQRNRIATSAYLRASGLGSVDGNGSVSTGRAATRALLRAMDAQQANGVLPLLGQLYRDELRMEQQLADAMSECVKDHPTWPWLERVRGIGPVLSARLLARLRIERAATPSAFWKYCGLATEEGHQYTCCACGAQVTVPAGRATHRVHKTPDGRECREKLPDNQFRIVRVAMRHALRGQRRPFDGDARTICHIIGVSFLRRGREYRQVYDEQRERMRVDHAAWTQLHQHLSAMRLMEKLFVAHLWTVWHEQLGHQVRLPYEVARRGNFGVMRSPWSMVNE